MLKLYYARPSAYARPVWLALLEKGLEFELIPVDLSGEQFEAAFRSVNPFGHIPVLLDEGVRVIECLAILDYLEARYPQRKLMPSDAESVARVRMVQSLAFSELLPSSFQMLAHSKGTMDAKYGRLRMMNTLGFLEDLLGDRTFFAGEQLTIAEVVAGNLVWQVEGLGLSLANYPRLAAWSNRLLLRPAWRQIALSDREWIRFKRKMRVLPRLWKRQRRLRMGVLANDEN